MLLGEVQHQLLLRWLLLVPATRNSESLNATLLQLNLKLPRQLIGNPILPALHGGATAAFLEATAIITLSWGLIWEDMVSGALNLDNLDADHLPRLPKTIDFTVDYLRTGQPRDAYARAKVTRSGRRYASVSVEAWQDKRSYIFAQATGHFVVPSVGSVQKA